MAATIESKMESDVADMLTASTTGAPQFDFAEYFHGHTRASGWFSDRFGKPRRHFCGDFYGFFEDEQFVLDEKLFYTDGVTEVRQWRIQVSDSGIFTAESETLINGAHGFVSGNKLSMSYSMKVKIEEGKLWDLDMKDLMILQPDGSLHNITQVCKWGLRIGTVSTQYLRHNGDNLCVSNGSDGPEKTEQGVPARHLASVRS